MNFLRNENDYEILIRFRKISLHMECCQNENSVDSHLVYLILKNENSHHFHKILNIIFNSIYLQLAFFFF